MAHLLRDITDLYRQINRMVTAPRGSPGEANAVADATASARQVESEASPLPPSAVIFEPIFEVNPADVKPTEIKQSEAGPADAVTIARTGAWSLFRLLDAGRLESSGGPDRWRVTFAAGGHRAVFELLAGSVANPLASHDLSEFRCPRTLYNEWKRATRSGPTAWSGRPRLASFAATHVGLVRKVNEDACLARSEIGLWAVADGVAGGYAGDRASQLIVTYLKMLTAPVNISEFVEDVRESLNEVNRRLRATPLPAAMAALLRVQSSAC